MLKPVYLGTLPLLFVLFGGGAGVVLRNILEQKQCLMILKIYLFNLFKINKKILENSIEIMATQSHSEVELRLRLG